MSTQGPPNPLDEFKEGIDDKQPLVQRNQPRYAFGWFDKWLLLIPAGLVIIVLLLLWVSCNPKPDAPSLTLAPLPSGASATVGQPIQLTGTAPQGAEVQLYNRGNLVITGTAAEDGSYQFNLMPVQPGDYELQTVTIVNGTRLTSSTVTITVLGTTANNTNAPTSSAPSAAAATATVLAEPPAPNETVPAKIDPTAAATNSTGEPSANATAIPTGVGSESDTQTTAAVRTITLESSTGGTVTIKQPIQLSGTVSPGGEVQLYNDDKLFTSVTADANGKYQINLTIVQSGEYHLKAVTLVDGKRIESSVLTLTVADAETNNVNAPTLNAPTAEATNSAAGATASLTATAIPNNSDTAANNEPDANAPRVDLAENSIVLVGTLLNGSAPPNTKVVLYFNEIEVGRAQADTNGIWHVVVPDDFAPGNYVVTVQVMDLNDKSIAATPQALQIQVAPKPLLPITGGVPQAPEH